MLWRNVRVAFPYFCVMFVLKDVAGPEEDTFRIMLATDNHIGYMETDPVRGQDSITTFREILQLAVKHDVSIRASPTWPIMGASVLMSYHDHHTSC